MIMRESLRPTLSTPNAGSITQGGMKRDEDNATQRQIFRAMGPEQRLRAASQLYWSARALRAASLRTLRPELSEAEIAAKVREWSLYARD